MTRERDSLERLCERVRAHEEPNLLDRAFVREQLAARLAALGVTAAVVASAGKAAASNAAAPVLGAPLAGAPLAVSAGATLKAGSLAGVGAWVVGGASATAATALLVHAFVSAPALPPRATAVAAPPATVVVTAPAAAPTAPARAQPAPPTPAVSSASEPAAASAPKRTRTLVTPPGSAAAAKPSLVDEARSLARVQRALRDGDVSTALALLDEQDRSFRGGSLAAERAAARVLAGCSLGRGQAQVQAERFVAQNAGSPLAERVQRKCLGRR